MMFVMVMTLSTLVLHSQDGLVFRTPSTHHLHDKIVFLVSAVEGSQKRWVRRLLRVVVCCGHVRDHLEDGEVNTPEGVCESRRRYTKQRCDNYCDSKVLPNCRYLMEDVVPIREKHL